MIPAGNREKILDVLDEEEIDYVITDETSGRDYTAVVSFPLPTEAVEPILARLRDAGVERDAYTVVLDAQTVISARFKQLQKRYEAEEQDSDRIAREELQAQAAELAPRIPTYVVMTVISAVVATAGVLIDSPAVVVGSMVIAPLVGPAMATSVGSVIDDRDLFRRGIRLQIYGLAVAVVSAAAFALFVRTTRLVPPTLDVISLSQFEGRLTPDFLSLAVALGAGVAGAVSLTSGVSIALVGVMIAAALVPPIAVVGIGIAWWLPMTVLSSGVLVLVNVLSINLAALGVLWYRGYRPTTLFQQESARRTTLRRILVLVVAIVGLSLFLAGTTYTAYWTSTFKSSAPQEVDNVLEEYPSLERLEVSIEYTDRLPFRQPKRVAVTVGYPRGDTPPPVADRIAERLNDGNGSPFGLVEVERIDVQVRYIPVERSSSGSSDSVRGVRASPAGVPA